MRPNFALAISTCFAPATVSVQRKVENAAAAASQVELETTTIGATEKVTVSVPTVK
mgnify:CR=1 FL=1